MSVEPVIATGLSSRLQLTLPWSGRGQHQRMLTFTEDLSALLQAGIALDRALAIMASVARDETLAALIAQVQESVRKGRSLSVALADLPEVFSTFYINMVQASEAAGDIGAGLQDLGYLSGTQPGAAGENPVGTDLPRHSVVCRSAVAAG